jgi:hypothetical protein
MMTISTETKLAAPRRVAIQAGNGAIITSDARGLEILEAIETNKTEVVWSDPGSVGQALSLFAVVQARRKA